VQTRTQDVPLSPLVKQARTIYEESLKPLLEPKFSGKAVAVHVDSGDYAVGETHSDAARALLARHEPDGRIVTLTIGPPTDADLRLAARITAGRKR
jgi:hypothetical protein